jgi:general secretion pathway protein F
VNPQALGPINLVLLAPPALAILVATRILFGRGGRAGDDPMHVLLSISSTTMFILAAGGALLGLVGAWILFIPLPIAAIILGLMIYDRTRRSENRALIWALSSAASRGIPLPEAARAYSDETPGRTGVRSLALAENLERGQPLDGASRSARLRMGTAMRLTVKMAEPLGLLGPAMRQQLEDSQVIDVTLREAIGRFFYLATVVIVMQSVCTFVMLKIVPVFQRMFEEFGLKLPALTNLVINSSRWFSNYGAIFVVFITGIILPLFFIGAALYYIGFFPRGLPLWWPIFRRYDGALVMRGLALAIRRGLPMPQALRIVEDSYPLPIVRQKLNVACQRVEAGSDWCQALRDTRLIGQADAAVLAAAQRVGNLDWALEEMAASAIRRQAERVQIALNVLFPLLLLSLGLLVFLFVCGLFLPLITLIQGLS